MRANHHIHTPRWSNCCNNAWKSSIARLLSAFGRTVVCSSKKSVAGAVTDVRSTRGPAYGSRRACLSFRVALAASAQVASKQNHQSTRNVGQWSSLRVQRTPGRQRDIPMVLIPFQTGFGSCGRPRATAAIGHSASIKRALARSMG